MSNFKAKMHQIRSPGPLAGFKGPTSKGRGGEGKGGERKGEGREGKEGKGEGRKGKGREGPHQIGGPREPKHVKTALLETNIPL